MWDLLPAPVGMNANHCDTGCRTRFGSARRTSTRWEGFPFHLHGRQSPRQFGDACVSDKCAAHAEHLQFRQSRQMLYSCVCHARDVNVQLFQDDEPLQVFEPSVCDLRADQIQMTKSPESFQMLEPIV